MKSQVLKILEKFSLCQGSNLRSLAIRATARPLHYGDTNSNVYQRLLVLMYEVHITFITCSNPAAGLNSACRDGEGNCRFFVIYSTRLR